MTRYRYKPNATAKTAFIANMQALDVWLNGEGRKYHAH